MPVIAGGCLRAGRTPERSRSLGRAFRPSGRAGSATATLLRWPVGPTPDQANEPLALSAVYPPRPRSVSATHSLESSPGSLVLCIAAQADKSAREGKLLGPSG